MDSEMGIKAYWPDILRGVREFQNLADAEDPEVKNLWSSLQDVLTDQFVQSATGNGVSRWESILNIVPKGSDTPEERKFRILTRLNEQLPYSYRMLCQQLETLCGPDGYYAEIKNDEFTLIVKVALTVKSNFSDVNSLLRRIIPANLIVDLSLIYNEHGLLKKYTHKYLSNYRMMDLKSEVIE